MAETTASMIMPDVGQEEKTGSESELDAAWLVVCWNDPVNLMVYVTHVFQTVFGWHRHNHGKSRTLRSSTSEVHLARHHGA
jgi:ATP-dependent Clp protease adapter protein ClpS